MPRSPFRAGLRAAFVAVVATVAVFLGVLRASGAPLRRTIPGEPHDPRACTWACHDEGCRHVPRLPRVLTGDGGLFGATIRGLRAVGRLDRASPRRGYGAASLGLLAFGWPGLLVALFGLVVAQRVALARLRRGRA